MNYYAFYEEVDGRIYAAAQSDEDVNRLVSYGGRIEGEYNGIYSKLVPVSFPSDKETLSFLKLLGIINDEILDAIDKPDYYMIKEKLKAEHHKRKIKQLRHISKVLSTCKSDSKCKRYEEKLEKIFEDTFDF